ncbi:MAG: class I SAM-dependent methyltransferase [Methanocellales archaeon]|nr:class I SAM-dependent methyltransferase [Methanocellales archaeon]MDD3291212.1 class I SAM-dependent methyltransferase [Methanocellales archaeon]MDD5235312.1 class I SAM-dependent methyltransferase [Methanocellales archaeon]MDD5484532.1 class I SAM-dependent methyltransferase [Methanocellales archaeon]
MQNKEYPEAFKNHRKPYPKLFSSFVEYGKFCNRKVIDIGCGIGRYTSLFADQRCALLCGLDKSLDMLKKAKEKDLSGHYILGDAESLPFKNSSFDTAVMSQVIQWVYDKKLALSEIHRILKRKGVFLLNTLSHEQLSNLVLMKHFPEIYQIETERFPNIDALIELLNNTNFKISTIKEIQEFRKYDISQLVNFAADKATSALRLYAKDVGEDNFKTKIEEYNETLKATFLNNPIFEDHNYTLIVCIK